MTESDSMIVSGGDGGVDPITEADRGAIRKAMQRWPKRWAGIDAAKKKKWTDQLECAGDVAETLMNQADDADTKLNAAKTLVSVVKTAAMMEGQNQSDEHRLIDADRPTGGTQVNILNNVRTSDDPRAVLAEMLRDPAKAIELGRLADTFNGRNT